MHDNGLRSASGQALDARDPSGRDAAIRHLLQEGRRLEPAAPAFEQQWNAALAGLQQRRQQRRVQQRVTLLALAGLLALLVVGSRLLSPPPVQSSADVETLLASVRDVEHTPLDFLLDIPGAELSRQAPRFADASPSFGLSLPPTDEE